MNDEKIIELYFLRSEDAIKFTDIQYGSYCKTIALNILNNMSDADECVNDTYLQAWNSIPPTRPNSLKAFLGTITRNISINKIKARMTQKRCICEYAIAYDELENLFQTNQSTDDQIEEIFLRDLINKFLSKLTKENRMIFVARYWYFESITEISKKLNISESKTKMSLLRTRNSLKKYLEREGIKL